MNQIFSHQKRTSKIKTKKISNNLEVIYTFRSRGLNPFDDTKLTIKVTFKPGVTEPEIKIVNAMEVEFYSVTKFEIIKEKSKGYIENYFNTTLQYDGRLFIRVLSDDDLFIGLPKLVK